MTRIPAATPAATPATTPERTANRARRTRWVALATAASLLVATPALAQTGAWGRALGPSGAQADGYRGAPGMPGRFSVRGAPNGAMIAGAFLQRLPLGTEVTVETFAADPAEGAEPAATLKMTVGEDSEAAFAEQVAAASEDAAFLRATLGARTRRVELADVAPLVGRSGARLGAMSGATPGATPAAMPGATLGARLGAMGVPGLDDGQTVTVAVFAAADDAAPSATLSFTYGVDSAAAFRAQLQDALEGAAAVEVTLPEQVRTVDLNAAAAWDPAPFGGRPARR